MTITLRDVDGSNWEAATNLKVRDDQQAFVHPNWYSILQTIYIDIDLYGKAIYNDDEMVGYAMMGQDPDDKSGFIGRLMIDAAHQGKGYGKAALQLILDDLKSRFDLTEIFIRVAPENIAARNLYASLGFVDTGDLQNGEVVMRLPVK